MTVFQFEEFRQPKYVMIQVTLVSLNLNDCMLGILLSTLGTNLVYKR